MQSADAFDQNPKNQDTVQDGRVVVQNVQGRQNKGQGMNPRGGGAAGYEGAQNRVRNVNPEKLLFLAGGHDNAFDDDVDEQPVQDLALNVANVFQADDCDAFDSDIDEAPTTQTMFMANLSSVDLVTNEAGPSYDLDILSELQDHDHYQDVVYAHHEEHAMHDSVQLDRVVDSHADYTSDSNMILYDQYVKDNEVKENSKNDKIRSKPDKNRKRGEAEKSQKQLQWIEEEKLNKTQKEGP
nr:hypothetical protein [Tanacetum cinerariifolium]